MSNILIVYQGARYQCFQGYGDKRVLKKLGALYFLVDGLKNKAEMHNFYGQYENVTGGAANFYFNGNSPSSMRIIHHILHIILALPPYQHDWMGNSPSFMRIIHHILLIILALPPYQHD